MTYSEHVQISDDPRFEAISERQRRAIFRRHVAGLSEAESAPAAPIPTASSGAGMLCLMN